MENIKSRCRMCKVVIPKKRFVPGTYNTDDHWEIYCDECHVKTCFPTWYFDSDKSEKDFNAGVRSVVDFLNAEDISSMSQDNQWGFLEAIERINKLLGKAE